jgi:hypothetical protein
MTSRAFRLCEPYVFPLVPMTTTDYARNRSTVSSSPRFPWVPRGADPATWMRETVTATLKRSHYFPLFNIPDPASPSRPHVQPGTTNITSVEVIEQLHRLQIESLRTPCGLSFSRRIGEALAQVHIDWTPMPDEFQAAPGVVPPPTPINPRCSQRFCMLNGRLDVQDEMHSGLRAFGTGRTSPAIENGKPVLRLAAVIDIHSGSGKFAGLPGTMCVNGYITPPNGLGLCLMIRMMDPEGKIENGSSFAPLAPLQDPDPNASLMVFLGEPDASRPVELIPNSSGSGFIGSKVYERLRLVNFSCDTNGGRTLRGATSEGPIVGDVSAILYFNMLDPSPVIPIQTRQGVFRFFDAARKEIGMLYSNMTEGRAFRQQLPELPMPVFRFGGFGPVLGGTGAFANAEGMMSLNAAISVFPRTLSNLYLFRFYDPEHRLRDISSGLNA